MAAVKIQHKNCLQSTLLKKIINTLFAGLGRSVLGKLCPRSWVRPSACGLGGYSRPLAQFFPIRTSRPANNMYIFSCQMVTIVYLTHRNQQLTVFLELCSRKTVHFSEQIMSAEKYPSIFPRQMPTIVYLLHKHQDFSFLPKKLYEDTIFMFLVRGGAEDSCFVYASSNEK